MRILFLSGREVAYPRNQYLLHALCQVGKVDIVLKDGLVQASLKRSLLVGLMALPYLVFGRYDLIFVGFYGHLLMLPVGILKRQPVLFDAFISTYDTLVDDRQRWKANSIPAKLAKLVDRTSCYFADRILLDTLAQIEYFSSSFSIPAKKMVRVYVGSDENRFYPRSTEVIKDEVLFFGNFIPLQGTQVILKAAVLLDRMAPEIKFHLVGRGIQYHQALQFVKDNRLSNVRFDPPVPYSSLPDLIANASVCLGGHFGESGKAGRVIAGKTFHCLAMGKPTIVGDNIANRELLTHNFDAWFCAMNNPEALADSIQLLMSEPNLRNKLGQNARETFMENASLSKITTQICQSVRELMPKT